MDKPNFEFKGKYFINADLRLITALHIGGTEEGFEIGGMDNPVIKDPMTGVPFIPGSSLKGKMRSLLEWAHNLVKPEPDNDGWKAGPTTDSTNAIGIVFGIAADAQKEQILPGPTRLYVMDAYPKGYPYPEINETTSKQPESYDQIREWETSMGEGIFTEVKTENSIDRLTSKANPRSMERIPANSLFKTEFIFDVFEEADFNRLKVVFQGMALLEDSTLGGGGSRGSGRVTFENVTILLKHKGYYLGTEEKSLKEIKSNEFRSAKDFINKFDNIWQEQS